MLFYYLFANMLGWQWVGIGVAVFFAFIGFGIATFKIPESQNFEFTRKNGGEKIDATILKAIKFKQKGKKIYVYTKEASK